jgi:hypothetical protein
VTAPNWPGACPLLRVDLPCRCDGCSMINGESLVSAPCKKREVAGLPCWTSRCLAAIV